MEEEESILSNEGINSYYSPRKWYNSYKFPLVPLIKSEPENEYNTSSFSFKWLFFNYWTLDSFGFEIALVATEHWGIGVIGILPYSRWAITIPIPEKFGYWVDKNLGRKPKKLRY